jgi:hypothetical protein
MSLYLEFDPHSWFMGFAIKYNDDYNDPCEWTYNTDSKNCIVHGQRSHPSDNYCEGFTPKWNAFTDNGMSYSIDDLDAPTLHELHEKIRQYHLSKHNGYGERIAARRLEYLRNELREERMSYGESNELMGLIPYIDKSDVELLEAAGVPEN